MNLSIWNWITFLFQLCYYNCVRHIRDLTNIKPTCWLNKVYTLPFVYGDKNYRFAFKMKHFRQSKIQKVLVDDGEQKQDITSVVFEFMGPNYDFFQQDLTVADMGWKQLYVYKIDPFADDDDENRIEEVILQPTDKLIRMCQ